MFLAKGKLYFMRDVREQLACHRAWHPLRNLLRSLLPKLPNPQPRVQPNLQPSLWLESPFQCLLLSVQLFKVKYSCQKKWHKVPVSQ